MRIDIDGLSETDLVDLNHRIVARLRMLRQLHAHSQMMEFKIGDRVVFYPEGQSKAGTLTRYNRKTVTVITDDGEHWNVAPGLLRSTDDDDRGDASHLKLLPPRVK